MTATPSTPKTVEGWLVELRETHPSVGALYQDVLESEELAPVAKEIAEAYSAISTSMENGGTLYLCGNGGSFSDALHISGELLKSFARPRPLPADLAARLRAQPDGKDLATHLQAGLRAHVLGANPALASAVANDIPIAGIGYAQELCALGRPGDVLLGISTSGRARNVNLAVSTARALDMTTIGLTGRADNPLSKNVDISLCVGKGETYRAQEVHLALYHQLCLMLEAHFFATP